MKNSCSKCQEGSVEDPYGTGSFIKLTKADNGEQRQLNFIFGHKIRYGTVKDGNMA
jgi:hypothetical protein